MSEADKNKKMQEFQKKVQDYQTTKYNFQQMMQKEEGEATNKIYREASAEIQAIGKEKDYELVLEKSSGVLLYAKQAEDITEEVLMRYNKRTRSSEKDKKNLRGKEGKSKEESSSMTPEKAE
jgi:Skp family chaperone for outer membrane proteins